MHERNLYSIAISGAYPVSDAERHKIPQPQRPCPDRKQTTPLEIFPFVASKPTSATQKHSTKKKQSNSLSLVAYYMVQRQGRRPIDPHAYGMCPPEKWQTTPSRRHDSVGKSKTQRYRSKRIAKFSLCLRKGFATLPALPL